MKNCTICKQLLPLSEFNKHKDRKDGLQNKCRECSRRRARVYYESNREKHKAVVKLKTKRYVERNKSYVDDLKISLGCAFCPEKELCCLDFHHIDPTAKQFNIGKAVGGDKTSLQVILDEIAKCICVCSNCHRKLHAGVIQLANFKEDDGGKESVAQAKTR